jgi:hypothetical protein
MNNIRAGDGPGEVFQFPSGAARLLGHLDVGRDHGVRPLRLPRASWSRFPIEHEFLHAMVNCASGVRLLLRTAATSLRLEVRCTRIDLDDFIGTVNHFVAEVQGSIAAHAVATVDAIRNIPSSGAASRFQEIRGSSIIELAPLPQGEKDVVIWLPQGMVVDVLDIAAEQPVTHAAPVRRPLWVHHGSSISHCAGPVMPTSSWPVVAARLSNLELVNLGLRGNCMLDPFLADAIARAPADVVSLKVGVNIVGARSMDRRTFIPALHGFLDRVRQGHPRIPIVVSSSILWPGSEARPGPGDLEILPDGKVRRFTAGDAADVAKGALTMENSRSQLARAVAARQAEGDNIHYLDGLSLYGPEDEATFVMPDSLHPDANLYEEIGRRFARHVFGSEGLVPRQTIATETTER